VKSITVTRWDNTRNPLVPAMSRLLVPGSLRPVAASLAVDPNHWVKRGVALFLALAY
jgi:hypothetical protein